MSVLEINFCVDCGNSVKGNKYCSKCGKEIKITVLTSDENEVSLKGNNQVKVTESCEVDKSNGKELLKRHSDEETKNAEFFANELHNPKLYRNFSEWIRTMYNNNQIDVVEADYLIIKYSQLKNNLKSKVNKGDISLMQALDMMNLTFNIVKQKSLVSSSKLNFKSSKFNPKSGLFNFNSSDAKLTFWGILGLIGVLFLLGGEKVFETPQDLGGFPAWVGFLPIAFIGWILAKSIDSN
jgi:hypothetical protein